LAGFERGAADQNGAAGAVAEFERIVKEIQQRWSRGSGCARE
jgi:hypothetical protein